MRLGVVFLAPQVARRGLSAPTVITGADLDHIMARRLNALLDAIYAAFGQGRDGLVHLGPSESLSGEALAFARLVYSLMLGGKIGPS